jgi:hypothetical protein
VVHGEPSAPSSPELGLRPLRGSRSPAKGAGRQRRGQGTGWRPHLAPAGDEEAARWRGVAAVVGARRALPSERGVEGMKMGMSCGGGGRGVASFYRVGEVAGRVVMAAVVCFQVVAGYGGEAKSWRRRLREGKGGGGREASGPMLRRWP